MKKTVWVLYGYQYFGKPHLNVVSKKSWQKTYADHRTRNRKNLNEVKYITESNDKAVLIKMKELAKEK